MLCSVIPFLWKSWDDKYDEQTMSNVTDVQK